MAVSVVIIGSNNQVVMDKQRCKAALDQLIVIDV